jgi:AraC-like DNA-binding protein
MSSRPTIAAPALAKLLELAAGLGLDRRELAGDAGVDLAALGEDGRVPVAALHRLWTAVVQRSSRRDLSLEVASTYAPSDYGVVGFVCANAESLGGALHHLTRYLRLWTDEPRFELEDDRLLVRSSHPPGNLGVDCAIEAALAEVINAIRQVKERTFRPLEVWFHHPAPSDPRPFDRYFGRKVRFDAPIAQLVFSRSQLGSALPRADPRLGQLLSKVADDSLTRLGGADGVRSDLARWLEDRLRYGVPTLGQAARALRLSERTLRRRLEDEGTTFRDLLDATRAEMARAYVVDRRLPMSEVAFLLGFSEPSAFHRAFKRWTNKTPAAFRRMGP